MRAGSKVNHSPSARADINPLNAELNPICHLLVLLGDLTFMGPCILSIFQYTYPTRCNVTQFIYIWKLLCMFRVVLAPIIRSAYNCIYSIWYLSHRYCYLPLSWKSWNRFVCAVGGVRIQYIGNFSHRFMVGNSKYIFKYQLKINREIFTLTFCHSSELIQVSHINL
jgi:hypothetical protein